MCCLLCETYDGEPAYCIQNLRARLFVEARLYVARYVLTNSQRQDESSGGHRLITGKERYRWESGGQT